MIYEKFRSELSDEQSNFIENYMEIVDHAHFQEEQRAYYQGVNCRFVFHTKRKISTATHYLALAVVILIMNNFILETFVQILHFSVYPAKLMIDKYGDEVLRELAGKRLYRTYYARSHCSERDHLYQLRSGNEYGTYSSRESH